ncbi:aminotransferase class V-fold PLP-dependent enzyme [Enemella sp. A6]|uniref:aminotransferase class V-fold PLP-dependent enzyme n=1 Tax=Enemella sp. A6 TaxID=3440152 RepID=UPI003EBB2CE9
MLPPTTPLPIPTMSQAREAQRKLVAAASEHFAGNAIFSTDVGVNPPLGRPDTTARVEAALAMAFDAEAACLVQGAGTGAIRTALSAGPLSEGDRRPIVHDAADYATTATTFHDTAIQPVRVDFNDAEALARELAGGNVQWLYLQHTRQRLTDSYSPADVIAAARAAGVRTIVDDNYAVYRTPLMGSQLGASASAFSLFKLHGPEGVGVVVGDADVIERAHRANYSGGGQVQGHQALMALQQLVMVPVNWALQAQASVELAQRLAAGEVPGIVEAQLANAQDLCVIALLDRPVAPDLMRAAARCGAATHPVGSNSRYEILPMVYRLSGSNLETHPELRDRTLRINPMRADAELCVRILQRAEGEIDVP